MFENPLAGLFFLLMLWSLGAISSFLYLKKVNTRIVSLKREYQNYDGYMAAGVEKANFLRKIMMIVITNRNGEIVECEYLYGFTNFAKFRKKSDLIGKNILVADGFKNDIFYKVLLSCKNKIIEQIEKGK